MKAQIWLKNNYAFCVVGRDIFTIELRHTLRKRYVLKKIWSSYGKDVTIEFM